jgi:hypothetical protein
MIKSTDGGVSWQSINNGLPEAAFVEHIAIDPSDPSTIYVGGRNGLFKTIDGGAHWFSSSLPKTEIRSVTIHPATSAVYIGAAAGTEGFVAKLNPSGSGLVFSTFLGGLGNDNPRGVTVDSSGNVYVTGYTSSVDFLTTAGAIQRSLGGARNAFLTKLAADGRLVYSTYLGGLEVDEAGGVAVDSSGAAYIAGFTTSANFPTTASPGDPATPSGAKLFIAKIDGSQETPEEEGQSGPGVTSFSIEGKKLIVHGSGFSAGAVILINGQPQRTTNDSLSPDSKLIAKKGGKRLRKLRSAKIVVQNVDGKVSNEVSVSDSSQ